MASCKAKSDTVVVLFNTWSDESQEPPYEDAAGVVTGRGRQPLSRYQIPQHALL